MWTPAVLTAAYVFDASSDGLLSLLFSTLTCWPIRPTFTTVVHHHNLLDCSSTAWFGAGFCTPIPRGPPSSHTTAPRARSLDSRSRHTPHVHHRQADPFGGLFAEKPIKLIHARLAAIRAAKPAGKPSPAGAFQGAPNDAVLVSLAHRDLGDADPLRTRCAATLELFAH